MTKKVLILILLFALTGSGAVFTQESDTSKATSVSIGIGGFIGGDFGGGYESSSSYYSYDPQTGIPIYSTSSISVKQPYFGGGIFGFYDATYLELTFGFYGGTGKATTTETGQPDTESGFSVMNLNIGLLGKYPFTINEKIAVFPLLGAEFIICLSDDNALWLKAGAGLDFTLTPKTYLRFESLYGFALIDYAYNPFVSHGLTVNLAAGYKLY